MFAFRQVGLQHEHAFQCLLLFECRFVNLPGQRELALGRRQRVSKQLAFGVLAAGLFQAPPDGCFGLQAVLAENLLDLCELVRIFVRCRSRVSACC